MTEKEKMRLWAVEEMAELSSEMKLVKIYTPDNCFFVAYTRRILSSYCAVSAAFTARI